MTSLNVKDVLGATAIVINNPTKNIRNLLGIDDLDIIDWVLLSLSPGLFLGKQAIKWISGKITKNQEKERMYREIIRKQQAAIRKQQEINKKLEWRQRQADANNAYQRQQIEELKEQSRNLEEVISILRGLEEKLA